MVSDKSEDGLREVKKNLSGRKVYLDNSVEESRSSKPQVAGSNPARGTCDKVYSVI